MVKNLVDLHLYKALAVKCRYLRRRISNKALALIYRAIGRISQAVSETRHNEIASLSIEMLATNWQ